MTYEGMDVADGTDAGLAWESLIRGGLDQAERDRIEKALLEYCGQDTLAMVKLLEKLSVVFHTDVSGSPRLSSSFSTIAKYANPLRIVVAFLPELLTRSLSSSVLGALSKEERRTQSFARPMIPREL